MAPSDIKNNFFRITIGVMIFCSLLLTIAAFVMVRNWERQKLQSEFEQDAEDRYAALKRERDLNSETLAAVNAFFSSSKQVTRSEFRDFTTVLLANSPHIVALEWAPRVPHGNREAFEQTTQQEGFKAFRILEYSPNQTRARAEVRKEYFPISFVVPYQGNKSAMGLDLASDAVCKNAMVRASETGKTTATTRIASGQGEANPPVILLFSPIYKKKTPLESSRSRHEALQGFVVEVLRLDDLVKHSLAYLNPKGINLQLSDLSAPLERRLLYYHAAQKKGKPDASAQTGTPFLQPELRYTKTLLVAGREWQLLFIPTTEYLAQRTTRQPFFVLSGGLLLTGLLAFFLIIEVRRTEKLAESNVRLQSEIAARKHSEDVLRESEARFRSVFEEGPVGIFLADTAYKILKANKALCQTLGYEEQELLGKSLEIITHEADRERSRSAAMQLFEGGIPQIRMEKRYVKKDGTIVWAKLTANTVPSEEGRPLYALGIIEDLTESKMAEEQIRLLAYYDTLTGLPNRTFGKELMKRAIIQAKRAQQIFAILDIELDNFKRINDTLGHAVGDLLLQAVAQKLTGTMRSSDYVARSSENEEGASLSRVGGDEFTILLYDLKQAQDATKVARRLLAKVSEPFYVGGHEIFITTSIGIALYPDDGTDADELLKNADTAMTHSKNEGTNSFHFYSKTMHTSARELLTLENELHMALERNELMLYYQPKLDATTRKINGVEALIRWKHPQKGFISPAQFIPLAETSGLILPIGEFVLRTACAQSKKWQDAGLKQMRVFVNVSGRQLDQKNFAKIVQNTLRDTLLPPEYLGLEITESMIMRDSAEAIRALTELKKLGVQIAIDDFGTAYSSLSNLQRLPLHYLKIDQSFVKEVASNPGDQAIVGAIIAMAHSLKLKVIAEGVETEKQLAFLRAKGCDEMQGYLFSRPVPPETIPELLAKEPL